MKYAPAETSMISGTNLCFRRGIPGGRSRTSEI